MGLCSASEIADAAYIASRAQAFEDCKGLDNKHVWDNGEEREGGIVVLGEWLAGATRRYNERVPACSHISGEVMEEGCKQGLLVDKLKVLRWRAMRDSAGQLEKARLEATSASKSGTWLDAPPSKPLDLKLTNPEFRSRGGRRLGQELCEECACPFCFGVMDRWGIHAESCTAGGDKTVGHHIVRNDLYAHAKKGNTIPVLEAAGILTTLGIDENRVGAGGQRARREGGRNLERPADVLLCRGQDIRVGVAARGDGRVALDVGIVCPQAPSHLASAVVEALGAAEDYVRTKCGRQNTEERCRNAGVVFQPMIFESLGGVSKEAELVIKSINKAVAENTDTSETEVATHFWQRLSIDIQRSGHRAFSRRLRQRSLEGGDQVIGNLGLGGLLHMPEGL